MNLQKQFGFLLIIVIDLMGVPGAVWAQSPGTIVTIAGGGTNSPGDGGPATAAILSEPYGIAVDETGNVFITETGGGHRIRKIDSQGIITTIAGTGNFGFAGDDGPATLAQLFTPTSVVIDKTGNLYIADRSNHRIRKIDSNGIITTVAGTGVQGSAGDGGPATAANLFNPRGVAIDKTGILYILDILEEETARIRKVDANGVITTIAGGGTDFTGNPGPATLAQLGPASSIAIDSTGNLYVTESPPTGTDFHRVRKIDSNGIITMVAGAGAKGFGGDGGPATAALLDRPSGVSVDTEGNLYIAEMENNRIRRVDTAGIITTVAGKGHGFGTGGFSGDHGPATAAELNTPVNTAVDKKGNLYIADFYNRRIRVVIGTQVSLTLAIPSDTNTVAFQAIDGTQAFIKFQSGAISGHTLTFETFGKTPPALVQVVHPFSSPLLYFSLRTTLPSTATFAARITLKYTDSQLAAAGITDERSLTAAVFDSAHTTWMLAPTTADPATNTVVFTTTHFSIWALASVGPTGIDTDHADQVIPRVFALRPNRPNPFNPTTQMAYDVPQTTHVVLAIYNILGQEIARLVNEVKVPGRYVVTWDGRNWHGQSVASGVYLYRMATSAGFVQTRRMTLLK